MASKKKKIHLTQEQYNWAMGNTPKPSESKTVRISKEEYNRTGVNSIAPLSSTMVPKKETSNNEQKSFSFNVNDKYDDGYKTTGKKIGDYIKDSSLKDSEIFQKDDKFYYYDSKKKQYNEITNKTGYAPIKNPKAKEEPSKKVINKNIDQPDLAPRYTGKYEEPKQIVKAREDKLGLADRLSVEFSGKSDEDKKKMESELVQKEKDNARLAGVVNGLKNNGYIKAGAFDDGYQFGDVTKTVVSTGGSILNSVGRGAISFFEGVGDTINYGIAGVADLLGQDSFADTLREETSKSLTDQITMSSSESLWGENSLLEQKGDSVVESVGAMLPSIAIGSVASTTKGATALSSGSTFASTYGQGVSEAYANGATDEEAHAYGLINGIAETATEMMFGGLGKGSKALGVSKSAIPVDDVLAKTVSSKFKSKLAQNLTTAMIKSSGEGFEEVVSGILQGIGKKMTFESDKELSDILKDEQLLDQFIGGAVASGIMQAPGLVKSTKQGRNMSTGYTDNERKVVDNVTDSRFNEQIKDNPNMSQKEQNNLRNTIEETVKKDLDEGNLTPKEINNALGNDDYQIYQNESKRKQDLENQLKELQNKSATDMNYSEYNENNQKITDLQNEINSINLDDLKSKVDTPVENRIQNNDYLLQRSYVNYQNNQAQKGFKFEYQQPTDSKGKEVKISDLEKNVYDSASKVMNNTKESHDLADFTAKLSKDTGVQYEFTTTEDLKSRGYEVKDSIINGVNTDDGKVLINIDSDSVINRVVGHETTHLFENTEDYKTLQNELFEYAKTKGDFDKLKAKLTEIYKNVKGANIDNELTSELAGKYIFSDTEFVQNLSKHRNIFQKVYDQIKHLYKMATAGSKEARQLEKVKRAFEKVYQNNQAKVSDTTKFSIQTDKNGNKYVKVDTDQDIFKGKSLSEQNKIAKKYILDTFRENGLLYNGESINVNNKTATKYTNPKEKITKYNKSVKNRISTELDNLLSVSNKISESSDKKSHAFAKDGWEYYKTTFKIDNNYFTGILNVGKNGTQKTLYDINNIKKTTQNGKLDNSSVILNKSSFSANNVSQFNNNVKSNTSSKQYAPTSKNNTKYSLSQKNNIAPIKTTPNDILAKDVRLDNRPIAPLPDNINNQNSNIQSNTDVVTPINDTQENTQETTSTNKILNPVEIAQIKPENASTTPKIDNIKVSTGNGKSHFFDNIKDKVNMLSEDSKAKILSNDEVKYYQEVTNEDSLNKAFTKLAENGEVETRAWFNKASEKATDVDVAEGWILMKQYENVGDYDGMVQVAKKMREIGTKAGQTVQAFNIMNRMTPEGMVKYAQSELSEAYEQMIKGKTKKWIDQHKGDFELKPEEVKFIMDTMNEVSTMKDGYDKKVKLAEIQKLMTDKIPPAKGQGIKAWMRISMLFNPKTQVRNVLGNALIAPVNSFGDLFASGVDKLVSKKTGIRTVGKTSLKNYTKGMKKGLFESYNDFKKGINTRNIAGNRFEISEGKSFNDNTRIGKSLNRVDSLLSFMLDAGDRMFYEGSFVNSINNQMVLNNTDTVTQEMIDIATQEALSRTWQDNNKYTKAVLGIRKLMNMGRSYGLGDVLIPFAKTPANLTKAIVDYSPAGLVNTIVKGRKLKNAIDTGQFTPQMQHEFAQSLGKATAGTMLYVLGYALAKAGVISGESDDDKDVSNFMKNTMGVNSYSIKIGNKSFTYDWAQPLAAPLSIMANIVNSEDDKGQAMVEGIVGSLDSAGSILLEQSFLQSINEVLNDNDGVVSGVINQLLELPARAVPTFSKQIVDLIDGTQRTSFEYGNPLQSSINSIKAKIPGLSQTLAPSVDSMGREIQKYGGKNNIFNVFFNPANVANENVSESAKEIYRVYKQTGDSTILPRVAPYYVNSDGEKIVLDSKQREKLQKESGQLLEKGLDNMMKNDTYINASDEDKAEMINGLVNYSYNIAQHEVVGTELSQTYEKAYNFASNGGNIENYYIYKYSVKDMNSNEKENYLYNSDFSDDQKTLLYENITLSDFSDESKYLNYKTAKQLGVDINSWLNYSSQEFKSDIAPTGKTVTGSRKKKLISFVNSLNLTIPQKASLIKMSYSSYDSYDKQIMNQVNSLNISFMDKAKMVKTLGFDEYDNSIINYVDKNYSSMSEKTSVLKDLGFTVYTYKGRTYVR